MQVCYLYKVPSRQWGSVPTKKVAYVQLSHLTMYLQLIWFINMPGDKITLSSLCFDKNNIYIYT